MRNGTTRLRGVLAVWVLFMVLLSGRASAAEITVSAAMSLREAFAEIGARYEALHGRSAVRLNYGASGDLVRQIAGGAPVDVFASASARDMDDAASKGLIEPSSRADIASNRIVAVVPESSGIRVVSIADLVGADFKRIAVGNPRTTPIGRYTEQVFAYYGVAAGIRDRLVPVENVRQALDYAARGEVDAAMVYATDAIARRSSVRVLAEAPVGSHSPVAYPIALVRGANAEGADFIAFVLSGEGRAVLLRHGFGPPPGE
jgi:molybdate transport system substrate-binding protein